MDRKRCLSVCEEPDVDAGPSWAKQRCFPIDRPATNVMTIRNPLRSVFENLNKLRLENQLCDWVIKTNDNQEFPAHSLVLVFSSSYFKKIHSESCQDGLISLTTTLDLPARVLQQILDFTYTGKCTLRQDNVYDVLKAAFEYLFLDTVHECYQFIMNQIQPENCIYLYQSTKPYFTKDQSENVLKYICHHFREVLHQMRQPFELTAEEMVLILSSDDLNIADETSLYRFVVKWLDKDIRNRMPHVQSLYKYLRFGRMDRRALRKMKIKHLNKDDINFSHFINMNDQRFSNDVVLVIGGHTKPMIGIRRNSFIEVYDKCADRWFPMRNIGTPNEEYYFYNGACVLNNKVYMIGGYCNAPTYATTRRMTCFDPTTRVWEEKACMYEARHSLCVVALDGLIYAIGGIDEDYNLESAERYDPATNQWTRIASMSDSRCEAGVAALHGKIYIAGGLGYGYDALSTVEVYSPDTDQWSFINQMISPRYGLCLIAYQDAIYAMGGSDGDEGTLKTVERYEPIREPHWKYVKSMKISRRNLAAVVLDDKIYAVGGSYHPHLMKPTGTTECFGDDGSSSVQLKTKLLAKRCGHSAFVLSGLQNAKEYSYVAFCAREKAERVTQNENFISAVYS